MHTTPLDDFYLQQDEPAKSCFLALKDLILSQDINITNEWKYKVPFFCYKGKMFCYLWYHKKYKQPYIGIVEGNRFEESFLLKEDRSRIKIMLINPHKDLELDAIQLILKKCLDLYRNGIIKINKK